MNKGLEIIEARWLFDVLPERIDVVIHPQSILHSAVEFIDGSIIGQMGVPDMHLPIHYALYLPERSTSTQVPALDLIRAGTLTFEAPDEHRFPCLRLARGAAAEESTMACVLNAANEVAVSAFLEGRIRFIDIPEYIQRVLELHEPVEKPDLDDILEADRWARTAAHNVVGALAR
jgi:1-deoxy-D-xylulose-5-phosphate reductoisomerase